MSLAVLEVEQELTARAEAELPAYALAIEPVVAAVLAGWPRAAVRRAARVSRAWREAAAQVLAERGAAVVAADVADGTHVDAMRHLVATPRAVLTLAAAVYDLGDATNYLHLLNEPRGEEPPQGGGGDWDDGRAGQWDDW